MTPRLAAPTPEIIREAAALLRAGGLVAFPTETVYGLGANALDGMSVAKIFTAKGRPSFNPLIVHVADVDAAAELAEFSHDARAAAAQFWPGPLTLVLPRRAGCPVSDLCSAGLPTLALRVPAHPLALDLLRAAGVPVAAPSANKSGALSPTNPAHVVASLGNTVDLILAGGASSVGLESTVLDLTNGEALILRPGAVTAEEIAAVLGRPVRHDAGDEADDQKRPRSPGQLLKHYAPATPLRLNAIDLRPGEALLAFGSIRFMGIQGGGAAAELPEDLIRNLSAEGDLTEAASNLFRMLHDLDRAGAVGIAAMSLPEQGLGIAINDRLRRAAES